VSSSSTCVKIAAAAYFAAYDVVLSEVTEEDLSRSASEFFDQHRTLSGSLHKMDMCGVAYFDAMQDESRPSAAKSSADRARPAFKETVSASERRPKHPFLSRDSDIDLRDMVLESRAPERLRFMVWDKDGLYSGMFATMSSHKKYTSGTKWVVFLDVLGRKIAVEKSSLIAVPNVCDTSIRVCGLCAVQISNDSESLNTAGAGWCGTCKNTFYCCKQHQKEHLQQHRPSCKVTQTLGHDYNATKFKCPEIDSAIDTSLCAHVQDSCDLDVAMKVRAQGIRSLLKLLTVAVSKQALVASSTTPDDTAEYRGLACMQICLTYHKMAVCSLCLGQCEQAHKMMDRAQDYYDRPDRLNLNPYCQQAQFTAGWIHLERDVLIQACSYTHTHTRARCLALMLIQSWMTINKQEF
jgi:predicted RNA-binding protein